MGVVDAHKNHGVTQVHRFREFVHIAEILLKKNIYIYILPEAGDVEKQQQRLM
jgi:hypothetical protein